MTTKRAKVGSTQLDEKTMETMRKVGKPVSVQYIAHNTGLAWHQARSLLFKLTAEGKLRMTDTTKSWIFTLAEDSKKEGV